MKSMSLVGRRLTLLATLFALGIACTGSERVRVASDGAVTNTGAAGEDPSGSGGTGAGAGDGTAGAGAGSGSGAGGIIGGGNGGASTGAAATGGKGAAGAAGSQGSAGSGAGASSGIDGGAAGSDGSVEITYTNTIENSLKFYCGGCHLGTLIQAGFSISYAGVLGHVSAGNSNCSMLDSSKARVVPGKPANSLIYIKMSEASPPTGCGGHMPNSTNTVPANQQQLIHDWIMAGAKE
jgi:hypothetical protein